jgi:hypothetical protein
VCNCCAFEMAQIYSLFLIITLGVGKSHDFGPALINTFTVGSHKPLHNGPQLINPRLHACACVCACVRQSVRLFTVFLGNHGNSESEMWTYYACMVN